MLKNLKILSVEQYGAGPFGTQVLVDLGAEVIKIETPQMGGDMARTVGPSWVKGLPENASVAIIVVTRNISYTFDVFK